MRLFWIIQNAMSNDFLRKKEGNQTHTRENDQGGGRKVKEKLELCNHKPRSICIHQEPEKARNFQSQQRILSLTLQGEAGPADTLILSFGLQNCQRIISVVLSYQVCVKWLLQSQETTKVAILFSQSPVWGRQTHIHTKICEILPLNWR